MTQLQIIRMTIIVVVFFFVSSVAYPQLPPSAQILPSGFKVVGEKNIGGAIIIITARKQNENFPKPHMDQGIGLEITWTKNPMADKILGMLIKQPEDPAGQIPGSFTREEPCGKKQYRDGILSCRKVITTWVGSGKGTDLVTWRIGWSGKGQDGLVSITINNFYGNKETANSWIDSIIPRIKEGK